MHLKDGEWYPPASSTNRGRRNKTRSCVAGPAAEGQKEWKPAKCYLTVHDLEDIWNAQGRVCGWFNIPLDFNALHSNHQNYFPKHPAAPSVDRIDDDGDYTKDNVLICCRCANLGRNIYPADRMATFVNLIAEHIKPIPERNNLMKFLND